MKGMNKNGGYCNISVSGLFSSLIASFSGVDSLLILVLVVVVVLLLMFELALLEVFKQNC